jgi:hypothetical protein
MPGLIRGVARTAAVVGTATAVSGNVNRRQQRKFAEQDAAQATADAPQVAAPAADTNDQLAQLEKLAALKDQGILTEEEFAAKKAQILGL